MEPQNFDYLCKFLKDNSGYALTPEKNYLIENRLGPVAKAYEMESIGDLIKRLQNERNEKLQREIIEAFTTNETLFFRDTRPFNDLRDKIFPTIFEKKTTSRSLRIHCAACSSGQEPYSLTMLIAEEVPFFKSPISTSSNAGFASAIHVAALLFTLLMVCCYYVCFFGLFCHCLEG